MLNRSASLAMSTTILKALPCKLDIKRHPPSILYITASLAMSTSVLKALPGKLDIKSLSPSILYILASLAMSTSVLKALPCKLISKDTHLVLSVSRQASRCLQAFSKPCLVNLKKPRKIDNFLYRHFKQIYHFTSSISIQPVEKITYGDNSTKRYRNILRHELELKWIKLLQTPHPLCFNDNIYHEGNISR